MVSCRMQPPKARPDLDLPRSPPWASVAARESAASDVWNLARQFNLNSKDQKTVNFQKERDNESGKPSDYRALDNLLDAGQTAKAQIAYNELKAEGRSAEQIANRFDRQTPFTGNQARESQFVASLTPDQKALYQKARSEQEERRQAFRALAK